MKYTDRGGRITVSASQTRARSWSTLTDTGIGIEPALLPGIFDMFVQIEQGSSRRGAASASGWRWRAG